MLTKKGEQWNQYKSSRLTLEVTVVVHPFQKLKQCMHFSSNEKSKLYDMENGKEAGMF